MMVLQGAISQGRLHAHNILREGYYWPTLFRYAHAYVRRCKVCQMSTRKEKKVVIPLQPVSILGHFNNGNRYNRRDKPKLIQTT
jgi:hypothetical protein